jgi:hypothetical protein
MALLPGIAAYIAATVDAGPPISVVPVSIAAFTDDPRFMVVP